MYSFTEENYLKAIYHLSLEQKGTISTNAIAEKLQTRASTVTDMLRKLSDKNLLIYRKYQGVQLSPKGSEVAIGTIRKHRLWKVFLVKQLGFGWEEVHEIAEQLEHIQSAALTTRLDEYLGHPRYDPHGDPIPDKNGVFPSRVDRTLSDCKCGHHVIIKGVKDTSPDFLKFLKKINLDLGEELLVKEKETYDNSIRVALRNGNELSLSQQVSGNLLVKIIQAKPQL